MAEDLLKLLLTVADANKNQHETQEEMVKKLVNEMIINHLQSQTVSAAATANCYDIVQSFSKVMNYQIDHAITEKSELANEKAKRLQAEKETQDLRKQLEEIKLMKEDEGNKKEAERIRKDLNKLEVENSEVEETQEDMIKRVFNEAIANLQKTNSTSETSTSCNNDALLNEKLRQFDALAENVSGNSSKYMKAESNGNNGGKSYSDPAWFPGTSTRTSPYQDFPLNSNNIDCASNPFFGQANPNDKLKNTSKFTEDSCSHPSQPMNSFFNNKQFLDINQPIQGLYLVRNENFTQPPQQFPLQPSGGYNIPMDPNSFPQRNPQYMFNTNQSPFIPNFNQEPNQQNINQMNEAPGKKTRRKQSQPQEPKKNPTDGQQQPSDKNNTQKKKAAAKPQSNSESGEHTKNAGDSKSDETMKNSNATKPNINKTQEDMIKRVFNEAIANLQKTNSTSETSTSCNNDALLNEKLRQFDALAENVSGNSSKYMKAESNGNNGGKSYSDPAWFPGTSTRTSPYQDFPLNSNNIDCASNPFFGQANPNDKLKNTSKFTEDSCSHPSQPMNSFFNNKQFLDINQPIQGLYLVRNENFTQPPQQFPLQPSGGYNIPMDPNSFPQRNPQYMFNTNQSPFIPNFNQEPNQQNINQMNEAPGKKTRRKQSQPQEPKKNPTDGQQQPSDKNNTQKKKAAAKPQSNSESGEHTKNAGDSKSDETMKNSNATKPNINKTQEDVIKRVFNEAIANLQKTNSTSETSTSCNNDALLNEKLRQFDALAENVSGNAGDSKSDETMKNSNATKPNINSDAQTKQQKTENVQKKTENTASTSEKTSSGKGDTQTNKKKTENVPKKTENTGTTSEKLSSGKGDAQTNKKKAENTGSTSEKLSSGKGDAQTNKKKTENTGSTSEKLSSESKGETPLNQKKPEIGQEKPDTAGSAEKEDSSDPNAAKKKKPRKKKSTGEKQKSDSAGSDNSKDNINIFIVNKFPTIMDVENGNLLFTQEVKDIIMVAKANNKKIVETPKIVKDMILFKMSYPEAKLIILD
ncbi:uncharacterized protein LOC142332080 isoform X8 [Lycorma delicatula]|uniref:uncharacterized protein LOC142332080 isoform X8 n=1 Tax=Lycorma delicatula TaxID=130591 RepID=UPI003F512208